MATTSERVARAAAQRLESLHQAGVTYVAKVPFGPPVSGSVDHEVVESTVSAGPSEVVASKKKAKRTTSNPDADQATALAQVAAEVATCSACAELAETRTQTVFGVGNPDARLAFLGEAPGADEDRQGEPFVGRAGKLLTDMIEKGMRLRRDEVYILNILRCRPPGNRNPLPAEADACRGFLDRQLEIIRPEFICCLGAVAAQNLLDTTTPIGQLRGRVHDYFGMKVVCTYHPAYLLRNPSAKGKTWEDLQLLMREMGLKIPD